MYCGRAWLHVSLWQEVELVKERLGAANADLSDSNTAVGRLTATVASLKDQLLTLGEHAAQTAKARTEALKEVRVCVCERRVGCECGCNQ